MVVIAALTLLVAVIRLWTGT